jgi:hypothetical protein
VCCPHFVEITRLLMLTVCLATQTISESVLQSLRGHVEGKRQRYTRRNPLRISIHPHGKHFQGQQARFPPCNGSHFSLHQWAVVSLLIHSRTRLKSADQSRAMYASFLQFMGTQYSPEKIKGKWLTGQRRGRSQNLTDRWEIWGYDER